MHRIFMIFTPVLLPSYVKNVFNRIPKFNEYVRVFVHCFFRYNGQSLYVYTKLDKWYKKRLKVNVKYNTYMKQFDYKP